MRETASAKRDAQAARRAFERLLFDDDAKEHLAELRSATGFGSGHDHCEVRVWIPAVRDEEATQDVEDLYARQLTGPRGMIEDLVLRVNRLCDQVDPDVTLDGERAGDSGRSNDAEPAPVLPAAEASAAEPSEKADDAGREQDGEAPEPQTTPAADSENEERGALPSLREVMEGVPLDRDPWTQGIVDVPRSEVVLQAFLVQFRRVLQRFETVRQFVNQLPVPDEAGLYYGGSRSEKEAARLELSDLGELLDGVREDVFVYLEHVGTGRLVELDDGPMAAAHKLIRAVPGYRRRMDFIVGAAVEHLATLPNRGGLLAVAEQRRRAALDAAHHRKPRSGDDPGWPRTDQSGQRLTAESEYEPSGELAEPPTPRAQGT